MPVPVDRSPAAIAAALAKVEQICLGRGERFTEMRRLVLEALWRSEQPVRAYDLRGQLQRQLQRPLVAPTIYRALNFLVQQKFAARIESRGAFVPSAHPEHDHAGLFLICESCGTATEVTDPGVEALLGYRAEALGFHLARRVVELQGTCAACAGLAHGPVTARSARWPALAEGMGASFRDTGAPSEGSPFAPTGGAADRARDRPARPAATCRPFSPLNDI